MEAQIALLKQEKQQQAQKQNAELAQQIDLGVDQGWFDNVCDGLLLNNVPAPVRDITSPSPLSSVVSRVDAHHSDNGSSAVEELESTKVERRKKKSGNVAYKSLYRNDWWQVERRVNDLLDKARAHHLPTLLIKVNLTHLSLL